MSETARVITEEEKKWLMSLKEEDLTLDMIKNLFAYKLNNPPKFQPYDKVHLNNKELYNDGAIDTTVGRVVYNKVGLGEKILSIIGYQNMTIDKGGNGDLDDLMSKLLLTDKIDTETMAEYLDRTQYLGYGIAKFMNASMTSKLEITPDIVLKRKAELKEKYAKDLENGNTVTASKMENELIDMAKEYHKDTPDMQIYTSGCKGSVGNNFKNSSIMRGGMKNLANPTYRHISTASLVDGIPQEEIHEYCDLIVQASYGRAIGTREGGYEGKKLMSAFQTAQLDEKDSDCGSKGYIEVTLNKFNKGFFEYRYMIEGKKLKLLTPDNIKEYIGKTVKLRSPMFCKGDKYCNKCFGELYYMLGFRNVGILSNRIGTRLLNLSLKAFHDLTLKITEIDVDDYIE